MNPTDVRFVLVAPDGTWLSARTGDGSAPAVSGREVQELQREIESKGGLSPETAQAIARNPEGTPQPSKEFPVWIPAPKPEPKKRKRRR